MKMDTKVIDAVSHLRELIDSGRFPEQSRLPAERGLAAQLQIPRNVLRKALSVLESEGLIWRHVGKGTFVGSIPSQSDDAQVRVTYNTNPAEIMEVRLLLEPKMAAMAAQRATQYHIERMDKYARRCEETSDLVFNERWDLLLHETIAAATGNSLLISLYETVNKLRGSSVWGRMKESIMTPKRWKLYSRQHHDLVDAIRDRHAVKAEICMREHLETVRDHLLRI